LLRLAAIGQSLPTAVYLHTLDLPTHPRRRDIDVRHVDLRSDDLNGVALNVIAKTTPFDDAAIVSHISLEIDPEPAHWLSALANNHVVFRPAVINDGVVIGDVRDVRRLGDDRDVFTWGQDHLPEPWGAKVPHFDKAIICGTDVIV
jgi:hypothetical protein